LKLPKTVQKQFARPVVCKQEGEKDVFPVPFSLEEKSLDVIEEKENKILIVTSRFFPIVQTEKSLPKEPKLPKTPVSHAFRFSVSGTTQTPPRTKTSF